MAVKPLEQMTPAQRKARIAQLVKNPGTRSKVPTKYLPQNYRQARAQNTRLAAPIVPGGSTTQRDLAHQLDAATTLQYGPNAEGQSRARERDIAGWYDQYKADLAAHAANTQTIGGQATTALSNQATGIRGLDQTQLDAQQQAANASAAQRGATAGNLGPDASNASTVRQAMLAALAGGQTGANTANSTYADTLAHVVGPGQKLQAQAQARGDTDKLTREIGAFRTKTSGDITSAEAAGVDARTKNQIALAAFTGTQANQDATQTNAAGGEGKKYGYSPAEWLSLSPTRRAQIVKDAKPAPKGPTASDRKTQQEIDYFNKHGYYPKTGPPTKPKGTDAQPTTGPGSLPRAAEAKLVAQIQTAYDKLTNPPLWDRGPGKGKPMKPSEVLRQLHLQNIDPRVLNVARSLLHGKGKLGKWGVDNAHQLGIHVGGRWGVTASPTKTGSRGDAQ
jgi:hypothetical protein